MNSSSRQHRDSGRRAALLAAAAQCFADRAFDEVSMDDIAARAGVTKGLLFYYFGTKRQCYLAVIADFHQQLLDRAQSSDGVPTHELLSDLLDRYLDFAVNAEPAYRPIMSGDWALTRRCAPSSPSSVPGTARFHADGAAGRGGASGPSGRVRGFPEFT